MQDALLKLRGRAARAHDYNTDRIANAGFQALPGTESEQMAFGMPLAALSEHRRAALWKHWIGRLSRCVSWRLMAGACQNQLGHSLNFRLGRFFVLTLLLQFPLCPKFNRFTVHRVRQTV